MKRSHKLHHTNTQRADIHRSFHEWVNWRAKDHPQVSSSSWADVPLSQLRDLLQEYELGKPHTRPFAMREECIQRLLEVGLINPPPLQGWKEIETTHPVHFIALSSKVVFLADSSTISWSLLQTAASPSTPTLLGTAHELFRSCFVDNNPPLSTTPSPTRFSFFESKEVMKNEPLLDATPIPTPLPQPIGLVSNEDLDAQEFWAARLQPVLKKPKESTSAPLASPPKSEESVPPRFTSLLWPWPFVQVKPEEQDPPWQWEQIPNCPNCLQISDACTCSVRFLPGVTTQSIPNPNVDKNKDPYSNIPIRGIAWDAIREELLVIYGHAICRVHIIWTPAPHVQKIDCIGYPERSGNKDGTASLARFHSPTALAPDLRGRGEIWVVDSHNKRIRTIDSFNNVTTTQIDCTHETHGLVVDHTNRIWVSHAFEHCIKCYVDINDLKPICYGKYAGAPSDDIGENAEFNNPMGLAVDPHNNVYVADQWNGRVRKIETKTGMVRTILEKGRPRGHGLPSEAQAIGCLNLAIHPITFSILCTFAGPASRICQQICPMSLLFAYLAAGEWYRIKPFTKCARLVAEIFSFLIYGPLEYNEVPFDLGAEWIFSWSQRLETIRKVRENKQKK